MVYIILIWVNWRAIYQENRRWTWKIWKPNKKSLEILGGNFFLSRCFQMFVSQRSRYGASEKSMARWMKLYWGKGFPTAKMIVCGVGCSNVFVSTNACICSTLFLLTWFRRKHQCINDTGNLLFFSCFLNITTSFFWTAACLNDTWGKKSDEQHSLVYWDILYQWVHDVFSISPCNQQGMISGQIIATSHDLTPKGC